MTIFARTILICSFDFCRTIFLADGSLPPRNQKSYVLERLYSSHLWYTEMRHATISWIQLNDYLSHFTIIYFFDCRMHDYVCATF